MLKFVALPANVKLSFEYISKKLIHLIQSIIDDWNLALVAPNAS